MSFNDQVPEHIKKLGKRIDAIGWEIIQAETDARKADHWCDCEFCEVEPESGESAEALQAKVEELKAERVDAKKTLASLEKYATDRGLVTVGAGA